MPLSMSEASVPAITQMLTALSAILDKAAAHAAARGIDPTELIEARLAPDMLPLKRQVTMASDHAKGMVARLSGREIPKFDDTESSFDELKQRLEKTLAFVKSVPAAAIDGSETRDISLPLRSGRALSFTGQSYLIQFALPNFYFHVTTAYDILRHKGLEIGKRDFMGPQP
jgi:uncharacterized protein